MIFFKPLFQRNRIEFCLTSHILIVPNTTESVHAQKPVSKRLAHFFSSSHHFALLFVLLPFMLCYAMPCKKINLYLFMGFAVLIYGNNFGWRHLEGKTILWNIMVSKSLLRKSKNSLEPFTTLEAGCFANFFALFKIEPKL